MSYENCTYTNKNSVAQVKVHIYNETGEDVYIFVLIASAKVIKRCRVRTAQESGGVYETKNHTGDRGTVNPKQRRFVFGSSQILP